MAGPRKKNPASEKPEEGVIAEDAKSAEEGQTEEVSAEKLPTEEASEDGQADDFERFLSAEGSEWAREIARRVLGPLAPNDPIAAAHELLKLAVPDFDEVAHQKLHEVCEAAGVLRDRLLGHRDAVQRHLASKGDVRYRIVKPTLVNMGGGSTTLAAGKIVSREAYGAQYDVIVRQILRLPGVAEPYYGSE